MGETRVELRHLLEDLRDAYPTRPEEAIVTELVANSLDSKASEIRLLASREAKTLLAVDNGSGMSKENFEAYHDIAASTKSRGEGIGFAGLGVKLSLLVARSVVTETKKGPFHAATEWRLQDAKRAPWEWITPPGIVSAASGTAVLIQLKGVDSLLLDPSFIEKVIQHHYFPLLDDEFSKFLRQVYPRGVSFFVNNRLVQAPATLETAYSELFVIQIGRRRTVVGIGMLRKSSRELPEDERGIAVSTFGKVIKRGWDWLGLQPRNPEYLSGIVEVPRLSRILTTNKADFLKDATSLQQYYRYRKAIQEEIVSHLREMGELSERRERSQEDLKPLARELERALDQMIAEFPELSVLLGQRQKGEPVEGPLPVDYGQEAASPEDGVGIMTGTKGGDGIGGGVEVGGGDLPGEAPVPRENGKESVVLHRGHRKRAGFMIGFDDDPARLELAWLSGTTIWINRQHPAFQKALDLRAQSYHIAVAVAWVLAAHIRKEKSPMEFVNRFLGFWARLP